MIKRRQLFSIFGYTALSGFLSKIAFGQKVSEKTASAAEKSVLSPHCEALALVWSQQHALIREVETKYAQQIKGKEYVSAESRWWFDTDNRSWDVFRPIAPGQFDTTHWFSVAYLIDGKKVAEWFVDTDKKSVEVASPK